VSQSDKTEKATPKRREEARQKGQIAKSQDLTGAVVLLAGLFALGATGPATARPVVRAELVAVGVVVGPVGVVLRRVLDLVLRALDVHARLVDVDRVDHTRGQQDLLAEDPRPRVDHDVARPYVVARVVDLPDRAVQRLDGIAHQVGRAPRRVAVRPDVVLLHDGPPVD
jgi:hypothetical protein